MAKIAFFGFPAFGHVNPTLAVVGELRRRGHEVVFWCSRAFAERLQAAGAEFRGYDDASLEELTITPESLAQLPRLVAEASEWFLEERLEGLRQESFDLIVHDSVAPWGKCAARALGLPSVGSVSTFAFNRRMMKLARGLYDIPVSWSRTGMKLKSMWRILQARRRIRRRGLPPPGVVDLVFAKGTRATIVYNSPDFQPFAEDFGPDVHFVGPSLDPDRDEVDFPFQRLEAQRPLLYISLGTLFNREADFFRHCFEAFGDSRWQVVLTLGGGLDPVELQSQAPSNFILCRYAPQLRLLERASVAITRGGMNTVNECLYYGVPALAIPFLSEQALVAGRLVQVGAGLALKPKDVSPSQLKEAVEALSASTYTQKARQIGQSLRRSGGYREACDVIEGCLANSPSRSAETSQAIA
ncbi:MAG TPA: macrolide family glycosyltransferase [Acidobacteriota bacterium]|nr:macrolide family glycosyltransferase [Acidobacteriota bacterium]